RQPAISSLLASTGSGQYVTSIALPVIRSGEIQYVLLAEVDEKTWLRFLSLYPVVPGATMTLLDQNRIVIARTLNNDQWVGRSPAPALDEKSAASPLAAYQSVGLEGQWFYSAHSRAALSGWTVATGGPVAFGGCSLSPVLRVGPPPRAPGPAPRRARPIARALRFGASEAARVECPRGGRGGGDAGRGLHAD